MKNFKLLALIAILCLLMVVPTVAAPTRPVSDDIKLYVNGEKVIFPADDEQMYIDNHDRTMVPIRFPAETLGDKVTWNEEYRKVYIDQEETKYLPETHIMLTIESYMVVVDGETKMMDTLPTIISRNTAGRTMVPVRFISEYLGADVRWHSSSRTAHVFTEGQTQKEQDKVIIDTAKKLGVKNPVIEDKQITTWDNLPPGAATEITPEIQERLYDRGYNSDDGPYEPVEPLGYTAKTYPEAAKAILEAYPKIIGM